MPGWRDSVTSDFCWAETCEPGSNISIATAPAQALHILFFIVHLLRVSLTLLGRCTNVLVHLKQVPSGTAGRPDGIPANRLPPRSPAFHRRARSRSPGRAAGIRAPPRHDHLAGTAAGIAAVARRTRRPIRRQLDADPRCADAA